MLTVFYAESSKNRTYNNKRNWISAQQYVFTANKSIAEHLLDGGNFIAIDSPVEGEYTYYY